MTEPRKPDASRISPDLIRKIALGVGASALVIIALVVDVSTHPDSDEVTAEPAVVSSTPPPAPAAGEPAPESTLRPASCGDLRSVTVERETSVRWELVRESDTGGTACTRVSLYRGSERVSGFELPAGVTYVDGDAGLWTYVEGAQAVSINQTIPDMDLSRVWVIARTSDGKSVSAKLSDGQFALG